MTFENHDSGWPNVQLWALWIHWLLGKNPSLWVTWHAVINKLCTKWCMMEKPPCWFSKIFQGNNRTTRMIVLMFSHAVVPNDAIQISNYALIREQPWPSYHKVSATWKSFRKILTGDPSSSILFQISFSWWLTMFAPKIWAVSKVPNKIG